MAESLDHVQSDNRYEEEHVHQVYNSIASHFSSTRFKPWPVVDSFLRDLTPGSVGLDIGCGNGKYLTVRKDVFIVASDRSSELLKFAAQHQPHDVAIADTLNLPHSNGMFDFAISIAVVHHLSTQERRREAVKCIMQTLKPVTGQALIFVWALEQKGSRRGWDVGDEQDVLVPWVLKPERDSKQSATSDKKIVADVSDTDRSDNSGVQVERTVITGEQKEGTTSKESNTFHRYYHLYRQGELESDIKSVGGTIVRCGYDRDNWWAICSRDNA